MYCSMGNCDYVLYRMCENVSIAEAEYQYLSKCREFKCTR